MAHLPADELVSKKRNRRRKNRPPGAADNTAWAVMTPQELWKNICQEAKNYFDFSLEWCVTCQGPGRQGSSDNPQGRTGEKGWEPSVLAAGRGWPGGCLGLGRGGAVAVGKGRAGRWALSPAFLFSPSETVDQVVETYGLQKITLLREISLKTGIQVGKVSFPCPSARQVH